MSHVQKKRRFFMTVFCIKVDLSADNGATRRLRLFGSITSGNVGEVLLQLTREFDETENILIDFSGITEIDLAGLKLFCSCHRNLLFSGKELRITGHDHAVMRDAIPAEGRQAGWGCGIDWHHSCIWLSGG
ncbi:hypothetical protein Ppro_2712 [Pelobacter propionicus DSM 2379]|uniref:STAS domain-containing protein n=2 Tax=Pelobacter propionicus TaxID=29543 RepID=A1ASJ4_PELPD|nr:hypothetical protein Ppro_2712 [Pelobacter propionicus DSM 2379]